jgi:hypothetical protein
MSYPNKDLLSKHLDVFSLDFLKMSIAIGSIWQHSAKRLQYVVVGLGRCSRTCEEMVIYHQLHKSSDRQFPDLGVWVRPKREFLGRTTVNRRERIRFEYVDMAV